MGARSRARREKARTVQKAAEGEVRPGPYVLPVSGGWLPAGASTNFWQLGQDVQPLGSRSAVVEACVSAYAQTVAMCAGDHWKLNSKNGRDRVKTSALARMLRRPNAYQTISDFLMNATRQLYLDGNAYALALRNDRFEPTELHLMDSNLCRPHVAATGDVFYQLAGNAVIDREIPGQLTVPQRDVLHIRLHADRRYPFPLWGQSPLLAAYADIGFADAITQQQTNFYKNEARPSAVLTTDMTFDKDGVQFLRDRWDEQSQGIHQGKTPILTAGLKVMPWAAPSKDAQIAEVMKVTETHIAMAFRVPLQLLGIGGQSMGSTESLMQFWIATGLGFALNQIEEALGLLFQLKGVPDEYVEFDTSILLRSQFKDRIDGLARAVQGAILSPNEARAQEGYPEVKYGDEPRVQQQVVPLSAAAAIPAPGAPGAPQGPGPHPPPAPGPPAPPSAAGPKIDGEQKPVEKEKSATEHQFLVQREVKNLFATAAKINRNVVP